MIVLLRLNILFLIKYYQSFLSETTFSAVRIIGGLLCNFSSEWRFEKGTSGHISRSQWISIQFSFCVERFLRRMWGLRPAWTSRDRCGENLGLECSPNRTGITNAPSETGFKVTPQTVGAGRCAPLNEWAYFLYLWLFIN